MNNGMRFSLSVFAAVIWAAFIADPPANVDVISQEMAHALCGGVAIFLTILALAPWKDQ